ncbi:MAG: zinc ribbon domain-containing protein [Lachnospiraceae bacterium]|nr:zinc ribbon domain-containing protein [Lachnospiraceae bacterium]
MASRIIEEKKGKLANEEKELQRKMQADCAALGWLVSSNISNPSDVQSDIDFSGLMNDAEVHKQLNELLISIKKQSMRLEEIKRETEELEALKTCPKCGNIVGEDELFCASCGERLVKMTANVDENVCPQCGKPKKSDGAFCVFCGFRFNSQEPQKMEAPKERTCVKCGTKLPDDVVFCHVCGCKQPE